jgi:hypothetical protein
LGWKRAIPKSKRWAFQTVTAKGWSKVIPMGWRWVIH